MTERRSPAGLRPATARALPWLAGVAVFALALVLLAGRMALGRDPALGAQAAAAPSARQVVVRRIERRVVVTRVLGDDDATSAPAPAPAAGGSAPARSAPAPAPAAAPAPAPVTRAS
jgi:hypothetical protein